MFWAAASAQRAVVELLRASRDAGMEVVGWKGESEVHGRPDYFSADLRAFRGPRPGIDRVVVAMEDRRESMPVSGTA